MGGGGKPVRVARLDDIGGPAPDAAGPDAPLTADFASPGAQRGQAQRGQAQRGQAQRGQAQRGQAQRGAQVASFDIDIDPADRDPESGADGSGGGAPAPVALFDAPHLGGSREDVAVADLSGAASRRRARRPTARGARTPESPAVRPAVAGRPAAKDQENRHAGAETEASADSTTTTTTTTTTPDRRRTGRPRSGTRGAPSELDPDVDPVAAARAICLRLLTDRAHTRRELAQAMQRKGVPAEAATTVLERFDEAGLIDDAAFAEQWVRSRHAFRGLGRRAIAMELRRKGVADDVAGEALADVDAVAEDTRARELVDRKLRSLSVETADQRSVASRRLVGMLARKGYGGAVAYRVVRDALAARGAELEELEPPED